MYKFRFTLPVVVLVTGLSVWSCHKIKDPSDDTQNDDTVNIFSDYITGGSSEYFDIMTLNTHGFPADGENSINMLAELIKAMQPDVLALQEITNKTDFNKLDDLLEDYSGLYYPVNNSTYNLAYLINDREVTVDYSWSRVLFSGDYSSFPRLPFEIHVTHTTKDIDLYLINNHLKCCSGAENEARRRSASEKLHTYIMEEHPNDAVIVLGDLNDDITEPSLSNVFQVFLDDPQNFEFTDMGIAVGSPLWWSYPSWPSHIDHMLVTNELFGHVDTTIVFKPEAGYNMYPLVISDHRPEYLRLK